MKTKILLFAILAISIFFNFQGFEDLCTGEIGTRAFMTGDYGTVGQVCRFYDYSQFFPDQFKDKTDSFRLFTNN